MTAHHALIIYDTKFGNTWKIAQALTRGLQRVPSLTADCQPVDAVHAGLLEEASILLIGGPTEFFMESANVTKFFARIGAFDLQGKYGFAFDTHARGPLTGSAALAIARHMKRHGIRLLEPPRSAFTVAHVTAGHPTGGDIELTPGAEQEFELIGERLGKELQAAPPIVRRTAPGD